MVKTPRTRHSKPQRTPVTIELSANAPEPQADETSAAAAEETIEVSEAAQPAAEPDRSVEERLEEHEDLTPRQHAYDSGRQPDPPVTPPAPPARGNWSSNLVAGLLGGLLAGGAVLLLQPSQGQDTTIIDGVRAEVSAVRTDVDAVKSAAGTNASAVDQLRSELSALQAAVQANTGDPSAVAALNDKIAQIESSLGSLSSAQGLSQENEARIAAIEQSVAGLTSKLNAQASQPKIALSIAAAALKSALERGTPFSAELETFAAIAPDLPQIETLRAHAQSGVTSRADIAKAFPDAANAMAAAANPVAEDAGFFERLLSSAESVVQVRPIGDVPGEEPGARIARMEVAVNAGDYAKALSEYDALPDAVKAAGAAIAGQIKARAEVEQLADQLIAEAMKAA